VCLGEVDGDVQGELVGRTAGEHAVVVEGCDAFSETREPSDELLTQARLWA